MNDVMSLYSLRLIGIVDNASSDEVIAVALRAGAISR
jgi:hypothetical protein